MANERVLEMMRALQAPPAAPESGPTQFPGRIYHEIDPRSWMERLPQGDIAPGNNRDVIPPDVIMQLFGHQPGFSVDENVNHPYFPLPSEHKI